MARPECEGIELVVVGGANGRSHAAPPRTAGARGRRLGRVTDGELRALYGCAAALVFPSTYEGFGLPPVEAMASGCPVIVSTAGALPEVCGDAALYCAPGDVGALAGAIARIAGDVQLRTEMVTRGRARAAAYSWRTTARAVAGVVAEIGRAAPAGVAR
jgi:glycosyltransferase involved in cell wall biosynthesis